GPTATVIGIAIGTTIHQPLTNSCSVPTGGACVRRRLFFHFKKLDDLAPDRIHFRPKPDCASRLHAVSSFGGYCFCESLCSLWAQWPQLQAPAHRPQDRLRRRPRSRPRPLPLPRLLPRRSPSIFPPCCWPPETIPHGACASAQRGRSAWTVPATHLCLSSPRRSPAKRTATLGHI